MPRFITIGFAIVLLLHGVVAQKSEELKTKSRFGMLELDREDALIFNGKRLEPAVKVNSGMDLSQPYRIGVADVVLVTVIGGTACPYQYYFFSATKSGAKVTPAFGSCNEGTIVERKDGSLVVTMHGFQGPFEPEAQRQKAFHETHLFVFRDGSVTDHGKLVP